jgi:hypothetical protein
MRKALVLAALSLGCGGNSKSPNTAANVVEAPINTLLPLASGLESINPVERKKAAEGIAKLGPPARPLEQSLKKAREKETDAAAKRAIEAALGKIGG